MTTGADASPVRIDRPGHGVLVITLDRPSKRNAVDGRTSRALAAALDDLDGDPDLAVGVLTGAGGTFCAGMDLAAFLDGDAPEVPGRGFGGLTEAPPSKPLVAAVEGYALAGGCELVLACDLVVAAEDATFGLPEVGLGLIAGSGGLLRLPHRIPRAKAAELALTGDRFTATDAHGWGLVNRLVAPGTAQDAAVELATRIARNAPLALAATKRLLAASDLPPDEAWARQRTELHAIKATADAQEGARAFAEKRLPRWTAT
ncbi:crotonase/enoyl-CoA hydratase family protein [Actinomycetospora endophytica]|uniref:Crotonase/enoyl-CoA hydratase family protein n=1 Tax=Actinomycetospora endophytica TaxID=2291215 RepID=A0ABS8PI68_9PSEU|nr:crotonase/enoyl-CoA hydratase family protein [Actinomycetospora endophytica]MCD2197973.1 crotonase/enoyl-CoA hydratase family protein [Actinomycetospora endophytica]